MTRSSLRYELGERIRQDRRTSLYRALDRETNGAVLLKIIARECPTAAEVARLHREAKLLERLDGPGFLRCLGVREEGKHAYIVFQEEPPLVMLSAWLQRATIAGVEGRLALVRQLCDLVGRVHTAGIIHNDVRPANLAWKEQTQQLMLLGFGMATDLSYQSGESAAADVLEEALPYRSPEQTGRMNRVVDYRTDHYSLGVTAYELLVGGVPFTASDPIGLVHAHIAKPPIPPHEVNGAIPIALSRIVLRLLEKNAEDRYQSAGGLARDLDRCLSEQDFELAKSDVSSKFQMPQKLYGREKDLSTLLAALDSATSRRAELLLVTGPSGIGKSSLVHEIDRPVAERRGLFVTGKFDQFRRNEPYSALTVALRELVALLSRRSDRELASWKTVIQKSVAQTGQALLDLVPELTAIIGPQPSLEPLEPAQAQVRFNTVFERFIDGLTRSGCPLAIFLDDLQWADGPTLTILEVLLSRPDRRGLLIIGAYRDGEVSHDHPLQLMIDRLTLANVRIRRAALAPLNARDVTALLSEALHASRGSVSSLARALMAQTNGNPFFLSQLIEVLIQERLLAFSFDESRWIWDVEAIRSAGITDNVGEMMVEKLELLPEETRRLVRTAACIGSAFDVQVLASISGTSTSEVVTSLWPALAAGLLLTVGGGGTVARLKFLHDRIQQAAYALIDDKDRDRVHCDIGRRLLAETDEEQRCERIFDIVSHLNKGHRLIREDVELLELAKLNLEAASRARDTIAFKPMLEFASAAREYVARAKSGARRTLATEAGLACAEANYLEGNHGAVDALLLEAAAHWDDPLSLIRATKIRVQSYSAQGRGVDAVREGLRVLTELGMRVSPDAKARDVIKAFLKSKLRLAFVDLEGIASRPKLTDPVKLAALELCILLAPVSSNVLPFVLPMLVFQMMYSLLEDGVSPVGVLGLAGYAIILGEVGDVRLSRRFDELSQPLIETFGRPSELAYGLGGKAYFTCWRWMPFAKVCEKLEAARDAAYRSGNLELVGFGIAAPICMGLLGGDSLDALATRIPIATMHAAFRPFLRLISSLIDPEWKGEAVRSSVFDEHLGSNIVALFNGAVCAAYGDVLFNRPESAFAKLEEAERHLEALPSTMAHPLFFYLQSLAGIGMYRSLRSKNKGALRKARKNLKKLRRYAKEAPFNFLQQALLVEAELESVRGRDRRAEALYERAREVALDNGIARDAALACELQAAHLRRTGQPEHADRVLRLAHSHYERWGARSKVRDLEESHLSELRAA